MTELSAAIRCASSDREMQELIQATVGQPGLMLFAKFDQGVVIYKGSERNARGVVRLLIGNPLMMASMARHVPDAGSYAPVTVLIDERSDRIHLSYDRMTSFLAPYKSAEALEIAKLLDTKIENLLRRAASL